MNLLILYDRNIIEDIQLANIQLLSYIFVEHSPVANVLYTTRFPVVNYSAFVYLRNIAKLTTYLGCNVSKEDAIILGLKFTCMTLPDDIANAIYMHTDHELVVDLKYRADQFEILI